MYAKPGSENIVPNIMSSKSRLSSVSGRKKGEEEVQASSSTHVLGKYIAEEIVSILKLPTNITAEQSSNMLLLVECYMCLVDVETNVRSKSSSLVLLAQGNLLQMLPAQLVNGLVSEYTLFLTNQTFPRVSKKPPQYSGQGIQYGIVGYPNVQNIALLSDVLSVSVALQYIACGYSETRSSESPESLFSSVYDASTLVQNINTTVAFAADGSITYNYEPVCVSSWIPPSFVITTIIKVLQDTLQEQFFLFKHANNKVTRKSDEEMIEIHKYCVQALKQVEQIVSLVCNVCIAFRRYLSLFITEAAVLLPLVNVLIETFVLRPSQSSKQSQHGQLLLLGLYLTITHTRNTSNIDPGMILRLLMQQEMVEDTIEVVLEEDDISIVDYNDDGLDDRQVNLNSTVHVILVLLQSECSRVTQPKFQTSHSNVNSTFKSTQVALQEQPPDVPMLVRQLCLAYTACPVSLTKFANVCNSTQMRVTEVCSVFVYALFRNLLPSPFLPLFRTNSSKKEVTAALQSTSTSTSQTKWSSYVISTVTHIMEVYNMPVYPVVQYILPVLLQYVHSICEQILQYSQSCINGISTNILATLYQCLAIISCKVNINKIDTSLVLRQPRQLPDSMNSSNHNENDENVNIWLKSQDQAHWNVITDLHEVLCVCQEDGEIPQFAKNTNMFFLDCGICHYWFHGPCVGFRSAKEWHSSGISWCCKGCTTRSKTVDTLDMLGISSINRVVENTCQSMIKNKENKEHAENKDSEHVSTLYTEILAAYIASIGDDVLSKDALLTSMMMLQCRIQKQLPNMEISLRKLDTALYEFVQGVVQQKEMAVLLPMIQNALVPFLNTSNSASNTLNNGDIGCAFLQQLIFCSIHQPNTSLRSMWGLGQSAKSPLQGSKALQNATRKLLVQPALPALSHRVQISLVQALDNITPTSSRSRLFRSVQPAFQSGSFLAAPRTTALLQEQLSDANAIVRSQALTVLGRVVTEAYSSERSPQLVRLLCNMQSDTSIMVCKSAASAQFTYLQHNTWTYMGYTADINEQTITKGTETMKTSLSSSELRLLNPLLLPCVVELVRSIDTQDVALTQVIMHGLWKLLFFYADPTVSIIHVFSTLFRTVRTETIKLQKLFLGKVPFKTKSTNIYNSDACRAKLSSLVSFILKQTCSAELEEQQIFSSFTQLPSIEVYIECIKENSFNHLRVVDLYNVISSISEASVSCVQPHQSDLLKLANLVKITDATFYPLYSTIRHILPYSTHSHYKLGLEQSVFFDTPLRALATPNTPAVALPEICKMVSVIIRVSVDRCDSVDHNNLAEQACPNCRLQCTKILKLLVVFFSQCFQRCNAGAITDPREVASVIHAVGILSAIIQYIPISTILQVAACDNYDKKPLQTLPVNSMHCPTLPIFASPEVAVIAYFSTKNSTVLQYMSQSTSKTIPTDLFDGYHAFLQSMLSISMVLYYNVHNHIALKQVALQLYMSILPSLPGAALASASTASYIIDKNGKKMIHVAPQALITNIIDDISQIEVTFHVDPLYDSIQNCDMDTMRVHNDSMHFEPGFEAKRVLYSQMQLNHLLNQLDFDIVTIQALSAKSRGDTSLDYDSDTELLTHVCPQKVPPNSKVGKLTKTRKPEVKRRKRKEIFTDSEEDTSDSSDSPNPMTMSKSNNNNNNNNDMDDTNNDNNDSNPTDDIEVKLRASCLFHIPQRIVVASRSFTLFELLPGYIAPLLPMFLRCADYTQVHAVHTASQQLQCTLAKQAQCDSNEIQPLLLQASKDSLFSTNTLREEMIEIVKKTQVPRIDKGIQQCMDAPVDIQSGLVYQHHAYLYEQNSSLYMHANIDVIYNTECSLEEALPGVYDNAVATTRDHVQGIKKMKSYKQKKNTTNTANVLALPTLLWGGALELCNAVDEKGCTIVETKDIVETRNQLRKTLIPSQGNILQDPVYSSLLSNTVTSGYRVFRIHGEQERNKSRPTQPYIWPYLPKSIPIRKNCLQQQLQTISQFHIYEEQPPVYQNPLCQLYMGGITDSTNPYSYNFKIEKESLAVDTIYTGIQGVFQSLSFLSEQSKCPQTQYDHAVLHALSVALVQQRLDRWVELAQSLCFRLGQPAGYLPPPAYDDLRLKHIAKMDEDVGTVLLSIASNHTSVLAVQTKLQSTTCALTGMTLLHQFSRRLTGLYGLSTISLSGAIPKTALQMASEVNNISQVCDIHDLPAVGMLQSIIDTKLQLVTRLQSKKKLQPILIPVISEFQAILSCIQSISVTSTTSASVENQEWKEMRELFSTSNILTEAEYAISRQICTTYYRDMLALAVKWDTLDQDETSQNIPMQLTSILTDTILASVHASHQFLTSKIVTALLQDTQILKIAQDTAKCFQTDTFSASTVVIQFIMIEAFLAMHLVPYIEILSVTMKYTQNELQDAELMTLGTVLKKKPVRKAPAKRQREIIVDTDDSDSDFA